MGKLRNFVNPQSCKPAIADAYVDSGSSSRKSGVGSIVTSDGQFSGEGATNGDVFEDSVVQRYVYRNGEFYKD